MDFLIDSNGETSDSAAESTAKPWRVLIVDDAQDVHDATRLALRNVNFKGCPIELLHAQDVTEAKAQLRAHDNIAVAVVDVVMESEYAGIELIDWMRNTHGNRLTRVILRTGQPGYAPESDVILKHEIDGYKEKSEITRTRLITMLVTSLRGYHQLRTLERHETGLRQLVDGLGEVLTNRDISCLAGDILNQLAGLLEVPADGFVCMADTAGDASLETLKLVAAAGRFAGSDGAGAAEVLAEDSRAVLEECIASRQPVMRHDYAAVCLKSGDRLLGAALVAVDGDAAAESDSTELLQLFAMNASVGCENARLFEHVHKLAYSNPATGLPNFAAFAEAFENQRRSAGDDRCAVVLFDVQRYRVIEHGIGPEHGLQALQAIGARLHQGLPDTSVVAHRREDEFAFMLTGDQVYRPEEIVARIEGLFEEPLRVGEVVLTLRPRLAIATREEPNDDVHVLARKAGVALDELRRSRTTGARYLVYDESMRWAAYERLRLASLLSGESGAALSHVYYQPILDARTEALVAGEALMRFIQPDGTLLHTGDAIEAAEASGLILDLGRWALERGMAQHQRLADAGLDVALNVNLSPAQIQSNQIERTFNESFERTGFDPRRLNVEVTEGLFMDSDGRSVDILKRLRQRGARILIDDFGTGYSSLSYLRKLPVDGLKIDRSFVRDMVADKDCNAVVGSIVGVGNALGLELTAEGVETAEQRDALREMDVDKLQGFFYAKALPPEDFHTFAAKRRP